MRRALALISVGLFFTLGACGNDDDASSDTTVAETTVAPEETAATETTAAEDTAADEPEDTVASDTTVALADDTTPTETTSKTTSEDAPTIAKLIAEGIKESAGESITSDQADCMATSMLDRLGAEKLIAFGSSGADFDKLPDEDQAAIFETFSDCGDVLPMIMAAEIAKDGSVTQEQALCMSKGLVDEIGVSGLLALSKDSSNVDPATQVKLVEALGKCLPPEVLATLG